MVFKIRTLSLPIPRTREDRLIINCSRLKRFSLRELEVATNKFSKKNIVGRGGFGKVYRGILRDGSVVAVKRLKEGRKHDGELEFQAEVLIRVCQVSDHRNVLRLRGYCMTQKERLLVYPFMVNGSVASKLRDRPKSEPPLGWATRKRIALGAAKGLAHFHSGCSSFTVIHLDVKASNILLDDQFEAVLGDFGLAKFVDGSSHEEPSDSGWVPIDEDAVEDESDDDKHNCFTASFLNFTKTVIAKAEDEDEGISISVAVDGIGGPYESRGGTEPQEHPYYDFTNTFDTHAIYGTYWYIAPEYWSTAKYCSVKNDVYGYGITLHEMEPAQPQPEQLHEI